MSTQRELIGIDYVPLAVTGQGLRDVHSYPLAKWHKTEATRIGGRRVSPDVAWQYPLIQIQPENSVALIVLDLDGPTKFTFADASFSELIPPANQVIERIKSRNLHALFYLRKPVHANPGSVWRPIRAVSWVAEYFAHVTGADSGYNGILIRNPIEDAHRDPRALDGPCRTHNGPTRPYDLTELLRYVPKGWHPPKVKRTGLGRHVDLMENGGRWYGKPSNWYATRGELERELHRINETFSCPLPSSEVKRAAAYLVRRQTDKLARGEQQARFSFIQTSRGIKSGASRRKWKAERDKTIVQAITSGRSLRDIGREYGLTEGGVRWIKNRGA